MGKTRVALFLAAAVLLPQLAQAQPASGTGDPRSQDPWVVSGEVGWNSLAGTGVVVARHLPANFTLDAGVGLSWVGPKLGLRARYNFVISPVTPFLGFGFLYGFGTKGFGNTWSYGDGPSYDYKVGGSPFVQAVAGVEYQAMTGFNLGATAGYARLLRENVTITGSPTADQMSNLRTFTGSGLVLSVSAGHAF